MVNLNLTLFIELGLFLTFLWGMARFVYRPLLKTMDQREEQISADRSRAKTGAAELKQLEREHAQKVAAIHRKASLEVARAHRAAQEAHNEQLEALKRRAEQEVAAARAEARRMVAEERQRYPELVAELARAIGDQLSLGSTRR